MRKKIFTLLIALFAIVIGMRAALPAGVYASTNTGDGAVWYNITWYGLDMPWGFVDWGGINRVNSTTMPPSDEARMFCFIGDDVNGYKIYNKAALAGETIFDGTATEDLPMVVLVNYDDRVGGDGICLGYTTGYSDNPGNFTDTWFVDLDEDGYAEIYNGNTTWWCDSQGLFLVAANLLGMPFSYSVTFQYVSGTPQTGIEAPLKKDNFNTFSENGKLVIESENLNGASFHVYTLAGQSVTGGILNASGSYEVALPSGVYVVKVGDSVKKVVVK